MTPESIVKAADVLFRLRLDPTFRLDHLAPDCVPADEAEGYQINDALHRKLSAAGYGDPAGYKLGCTTPLMQERIGLDHPAAGVIVNTCIFNHEVTHDGRVVRSMGIENEIVVRLGKDMPAGMAPWDG
ncbi:MAG: sulfate adenylyltransferase, partial [Alphaproteobacteria bacterium]